MNTGSSNEDLHLPWDRQSLETLIRKILTTGETSKVDFKGAFALVDAQQQGELLKDISAIANTYDHNYRNHGFLIFGVQQNAITGCSFPDNEDHIQASIDDLVKKYLAPFITTHLFFFLDDKNQWGVLVIPPTQNAPHVFIGDIHKRYRGDIYVRRGTTTGKAQAEDFPRFFRQHLDEYAYEFRQSVYDLQRQMANLETQVKKLSPRGTATSPRPRKITASECPSVTQPIVEPPRSITEKIDALLTNEEDQITKGLLHEARKISAFLGSDEIPWAAQPSDKEKTRAMFARIEEVCGEYWTAVAHLVIGDERGSYDDALLKTIGFLARTPSPPQGSYTEAGKYIRHYPLFVALYIIAVCGVAKKKEKLLKAILKIPLLGRTHYDEPLPITYILFLMRHSADLFHPLYESFPDRKWCDPIATYTRSLIDRIVNPDDPLWDKTAEFFKGEFVLCIAPMDLIEKETKKPMIGHPSSGLFLFLSESEPILQRFLKAEKDWIKKLFDRPLENILEEFDNRAHELSNGSGCFGGGFEDGAVAAAFPERKKSGNQ